MRDWAEIEKAQQRRKEYWERYGQAALPDDEQVVAEVDTDGEDETPLS